LNGAVFQKGADNIKYLPHSGIWQSSKGAAIQGNLFRPSSGEPFGLYGQFNDISYSICRGNTFCAISDRVLLAKDTPVGAALVWNKYGYDKMALYLLRQTRASCAAVCSASFLLFPFPLPMRSPLMYTVT